MAGRIQWNNSDTASNNRGGVAVATRKQPTAGRINWQPIQVDPIQQARDQHERDRRQMEEQGKRIDAELEKAQNPSFWGQTKNFFGSFKPSNIKATAKNAVQDAKNDPAGAVTAIPKGLFDVGTTILNNVSAVGQKGLNFITNPIVKKITGSPNDEVAQLPTFSEALDHYARIDAISRYGFDPGNQETDLSMALRTAATNVAGYELGGAAIRGAGVTNKVLSRLFGNVAGGQLTVDPKVSAKDRAKQAAFDAAFGIVTEGVGRVFSSFKKAPVQTPKIKSKVFTEPVPTSSQEIIYKPKKLGTDAKGEPVLAKTEYDSKTGRAIIYYDHSLDTNPLLKSKTFNHEIGHVLDKRMNNGSNLSAELPNYSGNKGNLDVVLEDFAAKQNKSVEQVVREVNSDINKLAKGSNQGEQFANAVAKYRESPKVSAKKAPTFTALLENNPIESRITERQVTLKEVKTERIPKVVTNQKARVKTIEPIIINPRTIESKFSSTGFKTGKTVKTKGYNPKTINAPEETQALFEKLGNGKGANSKRISKGNEDIRDLARMTGLTEEQLMKSKPGSIANAETVTAARQLVLDKAQELMNYLKGVDVSVASPEQLQGIKDRFVKLVTMQKSVAGLRTEASNVFRSLGLELMPGENATLSELGEVLKKAGLASGDDAALFAGKAAKEFNFTPGKKAFEGGLSTWYASILSGPKTTARNILSTSANILTELASKAGNPKLWKEIPASVSGLFRGLRQGVGEAVEVLKGAPSTGKFLETGKSLRPSPFDTHFKSPLVNKTIRTYGTMVESVGRFLNAQDTLLKAGAREMEAASHKIQGITDESLSKALSRSYAESTVYHGTPKGRLIGALRDSAQTLRGKFPESKIIIPFVDTVANVLDRQFDYLPIFSQLRLRDSVLMRQVERIAKDYNITGEANLNLIKIRLRDQQIGRMMLGTAVTGAATTLASQGRVSGVGPTNVNERNQLMETGWRPNSIKIGDTWVPYANLGPLAGIFSIAGNIYDKTHYDKSPTKDISSLIGKGIIGWTQTQLNSSFLSGAADLLDVMSGGISPEKYLTNLGAGLVPIPALYSQTKDMIWKQQYETRNIQDKLKQKLGVTSTLEPRLDAFGKSQKADLIYGLTPSSVKNDPVINFLVENDIVVGKPNLNQQYTIPGTQDKRTLDAKEYTRYLQESGDMIYQEINNNKDSLRDAPPDIREKEIQKIVDSIRTQVREGILSQ